MRFISHSRALAPRLAPASLASLAALALLTGAARGADLADADGGAATLPVITVSATKRALAADEVAGTVDTVGADELERRGLLSINQLDRIFADLQIRQRSSRAYSNVTIRGQSSVDFYNPTAQLYVDGLPQDQALFAQLLPQALEQVEILYGPQGTLYGRGAVGGIINVVTRRPRQPAGFDAAVGVDRLGHNAQVQANLPLVRDALYLDLAAGVRRERGEMRNMLNGARLGDGDDESSRLRLRFAPSGGPLELMLSAARASTSSDEEYYVMGPDLGRRQALPAPSHYRLRSDSLGLHAAWDVGGAVLSSLSGRQDRKLDRTIFGSYTPEQQTTFSQEVRLASTPAGRALDYVAGVYYQDLDFRREMPPAALSSRQNIRSRAVFGELVWHVSDQLDVTPGLRVERERAGADTRVAGAALRREKTFGANSSKLGLRYQLAPQTGVYALYSSGFKAGGFTRAVTPQNIAFSYEPQTSRNLELGVKSATPDRRLEVSAALYVVRTSGYQLSVGPVQGQYLQNVGEVETKGANLNLKWRPTDRLRLKTALALNDSAFAKYADPTGGGADLTGKTVPYAPPLTLNLGAEYDIALAGGAGRLTPRIGLSHVGKTHFNEANSISQQAYTLVDAGVTWRINQTVTLDVYGDNLADKAYAVYAFDAGAPYGVLAQVGRGRILGSRLHVSF